MAAIPDITRLLAEIQTWMDTKPKRLDEAERLLTQASNALTDYRREILRR